MALITCSKCGAQISEEAEKCPQCGNIINEEQSQLQNGDNKRRIKIVVVSETVLLAVAIVLAIVFWANGFNDKNMVSAVVALDTGIQQTTENFSIYIKYLYNAIDIKTAEQPRRYAMLQKEAHEFETECNKLFNGIRRIKVQCLNKSDETIDASNIENDTCTAKNPDDTYAASSVFDDDKMGDSLRIWMKNFRGMVLNMSIFRSDKKDPDSPPH
ncbi:MAG: zinc-ribbon domain-containing protein [Bacteroidales bacterium]|nr:zinc-ribbon domain-containing protein [Bacteroidales bacterium]